MAQPQYAETVFGNRSRIRVLRVLRGVRVPLNASQIAARAGLTHPAVTSAIDVLGSLGIVASSPAGRATVHWLERDNVFVREMVDPVLEAESSLAELVGEWLRDAFGADAQSIVLFGSYARGEQDASSDVDVALVGTDAAATARLDAAAADLVPAFGRAFGATLSPIVYHPDEAAALDSRAPGLADALRREGVTVLGTPPAEWARLG